MSFGWLFSGLLLAVVAGVGYSVVGFLLYPLSWRYSWLAICVAFWLRVGVALGWLLISLVVGCGV